jgi:ADP-ribosylglycohydrolase
VDTGQTVSKLDRITGALLGVHAGDSLGAALEFSSWQEIQDRYPHGLREIVGGGPFDWPAGHATDDTDLTRAVLLAYLDPGEDVVRTAADRMLQWYQGDWPGRTPGSPPVDVGGATRTGLLRYLDTGDPRAAGAGEGNAGNGSLMRCIPTALAGSDPDRRARDSVEISAITHDDRRCTASCVAYNEIVASLLEGTDAVPAVGTALTSARSGAPAAVLQAIFFGTTLSLPDAVRTGKTLLPNGGGGYVLDSLSLAIAAVLDPRSFEDVLVDVARLGGDTDTNAAIAGGLLGARDGAAAIPSRWRVKLQFAAEFETAAKELSSRH